MPFEFKIEPKLKRKEVLKEMSIYLQFIELII